MLCLLAERTLAIASFTIVYYMQDFYYPEGIAFPISGTDQAMIEMHYDNPGNTEGVISDQ